MVMDRRQFLQRTGCVALAGWGAFACAVPPGDGELARPAILSALGPEPVREIGRAYRKMVPGEREARSLRRALLDASERSGSRPGGRDAALQPAVRADFEQGRTVVVDGWILSVTEARQCALFSLLAA